jgi:hypothetical protein
VKSRGALSAPPPANILRGWLQGFQGREAAFALETTTGWRFVIEELRAAGLEAHLADPAGTRAWLPKQWRGGAVIRRGGELRRWRSSSPH